MVVLGVPRFGPAVRDCREDSGHVGIFGYSAVGEHVLDLGCFEVLASSRLVSSCLGEDCLLAIYAMQNAGVCG